MPLRVHPTANDLMRSYLACRPRVLLVMALSLWGLGRMSTPSCTAEPKRPNIIVLMADDLGYADLGCYGGEIETKNLDLLAERGTLYSQFRATPVCSKSRVALLAGMPMHAAGDMTYGRPTLSGHG
ncbi:Arylsulfatase [Planctomycetes bacterium MalM25]|nr:Arylsulfatase [Planctomycetes bacterium MalM25]